MQGRYRTSVAVDFVRWTVVHAVFRVSAGYARAFSVGGRAASDGLGLLGSLAWWLGCRRAGWLGGGVIRVLLEAEVFHLIGRHEVSVIVSDQRWGHGVVGWLNWRDWVWCVGKKSASHDELLS